MYKIYFSLRDTLWFYSCPEAALRLVSLVEEVPFVSWSASQRLSTQDSGHFVGENESGINDWLLNTPWQRSGPRPTPVPHPHPIKKNPFHLVTPLFGIFVFPKRPLMPLESETNNKISQKNQQVFRVLCCKAGFCPVSWLNIGYWLINKLPPTLFKES